MNQNTAVTIEAVEGTGWLIAWHPDSPSVAMAPDIPPDASPRLVRAVRERMFAIVVGECRHCGALAAPTPEMKTAAPGPARMNGHELVVHREGCLCSSAVVARMELECQAAAPRRDDDESIDRVAARYVEVHDVIRVRAVERQLEAGA